jgi:hypothetical protein
MHSAIVVIVVPETPYDANSNKRWQDFIADINLLRHTKPTPLHALPGVSRLGENVWQVNFQENPAALVRLVSCAIQHRFPYGILQLDAAPQWLPAGFDPTSTEDHSESALEGSDD